MSDAIAVAVKERTVSLTGFARNVMSALKALLQHSWKGIQAVVGIGERSKERSSGLMRKSEPRRCRLAGLHGGDHKFRGIHNTGRKRRLARSRHSNITGSATSTRTRPRRDRKNWGVVIVVENDRLRHQKERDLRESDEFY